MIQAELNAYGFSKGVPTQRVYRYLKIVNKTS